MKIYSKINLNCLLGIVFTILSTYLYYFLEWLFYLTKPSLFSYLSITNSTAVLFNSPIPILLILIPICFCVFLLSEKIKAENSYLRVYLNLVIPAFILAFTLFLLIDNNTYTFFEISSYTADMIYSKLTYLFLLCLLTVYFLRRLKKTQERVKNNLQLLNIGSILSVILLFLSLTSIGFTYKNVTFSANSTNNEIDKLTKELPNILFFSADGVNASNMSIYGYERQTTPFLDSISSELMIYKNHWTNSGKTTGSVGSLLSGKYPTRTKVVFRPDTFSNVDMYQHFPGLLKQLGYYNIDISARHYIDAEDLKLRKSFHYANNRNLDIEYSPLWESVTLNWPSTFEFLEETSNRFIYRLFHITGLKKWVNPYHIVTQNFKDSLSDIPRMKDLKEQLKNAPRPFFASVHLLGPHGSKFSYEKAVFTENKEQQEHWMIDHYDNAIFQWDKYSEEIYNFLKKRGELENTIIVFNSDHGWKHKINTTLPLIIRFPNKVYTGVNALPSQRIDIAPTILNFIGEPIPSWFDGTSLLSTRSGNQTFYIANSKASRLINKKDWKVATDPTPPFYSLGSVSIAICGNLYTVFLEKEIKSISEKVHGGNSSCDNQLLPDFQVKKLVYEHLKAMGYKTDYFINKT